LVLFKPLALQLQSLADEVTQLKATAQQQAQTLTQLQSRDIEAMALSYAKTHETSTETPIDAIADTPRRSWLNWVIMVVLTIAVMGLCHWMLLFVYDAPPLFLRLLTITLPALTGYGCARRSGFGGLMHLLAALLVAGLSVGLMLAITSP
jgi:hypothetical protein